jgi:hypothetical protein
MHGLSQGAPCTARTFSSKVSWKYSRRRYPRRMSGFHVQTMKQCHNDIHRTTVERCSVATHVVFDIGFMTRRKFFFSLTNCISIRHDVRSFVKWGLPTRSSSSTIMMEKKGTYVLAQPRQIVDLYTNLLTIPRKRNSPCDNDTKVQ